MNSGKTIAESRVTLSALMGPQDANVLGNVHGGVIMKLVDEAGALAAMRHARCPVVTVAIDSMTFLEPIYLGHMVSCQAELTYAGHTAMEVRIAVIAENPLTGQTIHTNLAYGVYVAIDLQTRRPHPVPPLIAETEEEQRRMEAARQRQAERKRRRVQEDVP